MPADEDKSSKTEEATPKKKQEAFEQGNFPKAEEIQVVFGLVSTFIVMLFVTVSAAEKIALMMGYVYGNLAKYLLTHEEVADYALTGGIRPVGTFGACFCFGDHLLNFGRWFANAISVNTESIAV